MLFTITIGIFQYTVRIRKPWFGTLSTKHHQRNSVKELLYSKNWYREGALNLKFVMVKNPKSIEFPTLLSRGPYISYPPGAVLPIYIISKLRRHEPTISLLMKYNLLNHFFIAFFISLIIFFFLLQLKFSYLNSFILSLVPISLELLLPAPLYWHQNVFFTDQAVILPFVLFVFFEVIRESIKNRKISISTNFLQSSVFFYGILTDWLFVFIALTVYIKRIFNGEIRKDFNPFIKMSLKYWFPALLALFLFAFQLYSLPAFSNIIERFLFRIGLNARGAGYIVNFYNRFWEGHIAKGYGEVAIGLLWMSLFLFILSFIYIGFQHFHKRQVEERIKKTLSLISILLIPCFLYTYFFRNNSWIHDFSALKFSIPLATVPFILIPILIFSFLKIDLRNLFLDGVKISYKKGRKDIEFKLPVITLCIVMLVSVYLKNEHVRFKSFFPYPDKSLEKIGEFISSNTQYKDVIFSPNFEISIKGSTLLCYSMKRVYKIDSIFDIYTKTNEIDSNFEINIFSIDKTVSINNHGIKELISMAYDIKQIDNLYLYKIRKDDFLEKFEEIRDQVRKDLLIEVEQVLKNKNIFELYGYKNKFNLIKIYPEVYTYFLEKFDEIKGEIKKDLLIEVKQVSKSRDVFELYKFKDKYGFIKEIYPEVYRDLNSEYETLLANYSSEYAISEKVSFVDYHYEKIDDGKYKFYFVFKVKSGFKKDWKVYFHGYVKGENVALLPQKRQKYKFDNWGFNPDPPTSTWAKDEYIIIKREISANPIIYNMNIGFYKRGEGRHGEQIKLGWLKLE